MSVEQFASATVKEITALTDGYMRRREALEDMFILYSALPTYQGHFGKKAPSYKKLTAHRRKNYATADIDDKLAEYWRDILKNC